MAKPPPPSAPPTLVHVAAGDVLVQGGAYVLLRLPASCADAELRLTAAQARALALALLSAAEQ